MKQTVRALFLYLTLLCLSACEKFEYSPYEAPRDPSVEPLNPANINRIKQREASEDDTVTILFTGDSQRSYHALDALVAKANSLSRIDFLVLAGDISDFGLEQEFSWIRERLNRLKMPYLCVVGNHDLTGSGPALYETVFGPRNFAFTYKGYKFIFHDTNSREYDFNGTVPDMGWLSNEIKANGASWMVGVSHVPPYDSDFDRALEKPYSQLFGSDRRFILSLHGHLHGWSDSFYYDDHVRYITSYSVDKETCTLLRFVKGQINAENIFY